MICYFLAAHFLFLIAPWVILVGEERLQGYSIFSLQYTQRRNSLYIHLALRPLLWAIFRWIWRTLLENTGHLSEILARSLHIIEEVERFVYYLENANYINITKRPNIIYPGYCIYDTLIGALRCYATIRTAFPLTIYHGGGILILINIPVKSYTGHLRWRYYTCTCIYC